jgi:hypothetical protein
MDKLIAKLNVAVDETKTRIAGLNWRKEFIEMINDDEYTPLKYYHVAVLVRTVALFDPENVYKTTKNRWHAILNTRTEEADAINKQCREAERLLKQLRAIELDALRVAWDAVEDDCEKPLLKCEDCDFFGWSERSAHEHECEKEDEDRTIKCKHCKKNCGTYERLKVHIKSKHFKPFKCEPCNVGYNTQMQFDRHTSSKKHKETCGIVKPTFECKLCDKQFMYQCKYDEHLLSVKHRKLSNLEKSV